MKNCWQKRREGEMFTDGCCCLCKLQNWKSLFRDFDGLSKIKKSKIFAKESGKDGGDLLLEEMSKITEILLTSWA